MQRAAALVVATLLVGCAEPRAQPDPLTEALPDVCMDEQSREKVRNLLSEALDAALKTHVEKVFGVWMQAISDEQQPPRARRGTRLGITAYVHAQTALAQWSPPTC